jgi:benzil reductase ((S)-benzoin forming)
MTQQLTILTGASRGLGLALAKQLLAPQHTLLCISRNRNEALAERASAQGATLVQWTKDLTQGPAVSHELERWLQAQAGTSFASATLINNAALISHLAPISEADVGEVAQALHVGLEAPMQLTAVFLRATAAWPAQRKVLNISSGAGQRAKANQATYCTVKAGLDHFTRCVALEEALNANGAKVCALAPGIVDTDMQAQLRGADQAVFPDRDYFVGLKNAGQLSLPEVAASRVLAYLARTDFGAQPVADVRDQHQLADRPARA